MEHFEEQIRLFKEKYNLSAEIVEEVKRLCMSHAINCSMDVKLLEQSSAWLVNKIIDRLEEEEKKLSQLEHLF
jgi:hypothetical protein